MEAQHSSYDSRTSIVIGHVDEDHDVSAVTVTTIETTLSKTCRESKGGVIYGDKDPNLKTVKTRFIRVNEEGSMMLVN